jgi:GC-rich sequence DNA-binding factor
MEWEQEQLKRGGLRAESAQPAKKTYVAATSENLAFPVILILISAVPPTTSLPTLNAAVDRLAEALTKLTTSHATHSTSIVTLAEDRKQLDERESELRKMVESAETKRGWFTAYREWVESLAIFLDEKVCLSIKPIIHS